MMFLALIAAVMPLSLQAVGIEFSFTHTISTVIKTYGKAISFVGCTYQPVLVAEVVALLNHCEEANPGSTNCPSNDQLACNPDQITIDGEMVELSPFSSVVEPMTVVADQVAASSPVRARRLIARRAEVEIPTLPSDEVLEVAFARVIEIPQRVVIRNSSTAGLELNFISKPVLSSRPANEFTRLVKASMASAEGQAMRIQHEDLIRRAEKLQIWTLNCNFKALKSFYKSEETKAVKASKKVQAEVAPLPITRSRVSEANYGEF